MGTGRGQSKELKAAYRGSLASPGSVAACATLQVIATAGAVCIRLTNSPLHCALHGRAIATSQKSNRTWPSVVMHADNPNILQAPRQTKKAPALCASCRDRFSVDNTCTTMAVLRGLNSAISFVFDPRTCDRANCDRHVKRYSMYRTAFAKRKPSVGRPAGPSLFKQRFVVISSNTTAPVQSKKQRESHLTAEYATHRPTSFGAP